MSRRVLDYSRGIITICLISTMITSGFIGFLVFEGMLDQGSVEAATITVDSKGGGDYKTIQQAIDNANSGDTIYVWAGTYNENLNIYKSITLIGNGSANTTIDGTGSGNGIYVWGNWVNISGFYITNTSSSGIRFNDVEHGHIYKNNCSNNDNGIYLYYSNNITIENNSCTNNHNGISNRDSNYNIIANNTLKFNTFGIGVIRSQSIIIKNNSMESCGLSIDSWQLSEFYSIEIDSNNTVNGKPVYYWRNVHDSSVPPGAGQVMFINCSNITMEYQNCSDASIGIFIAYSNNITIRNNTLENNTYASIYQIYSNSTLIVNNSWKNTTWGLLCFNSHFNLIHNNIISSNDYASIYLSGSNNNSIINNTCKNGGFYGIIIELCKNNIFKNNTIYSTGVYLWGNQISYWNSHSIDITNTINGKPIYYWKNIKGGIVPPGGSMVILANCSKVLVQDQIFDKVTNGITLAYSNNITIQNNTCPSNTLGGINTQYSDNNIITNNTCSYGYYGITVENSDSNIIKENKCSQNSEGISIYNSKLNTFSNNTCTINYDGINAYSSDTNTFIENTCVSNNGTGIYLRNSNSNVFISNNCSDNKRNGFSLYDSDFNLLNNNVCNFNLYYGIDFLEQSSSNIITNNTCNSNNVNGINLRYYCNLNNIENNICLNNEYGIRLDSALANNITNNTCSSNYGYGIELSYSWSNFVENNTCNFNNWTGIKVDESDYNIVINNTLEQNNLCGLILWYSHLNTIYNNSIILNGLEGIHSYGSDENTIQHNIITDSQVGINLSTNSDRNTIFENTISYNSELGFRIHISADWNFIYHNNIISNDIQAMDNSNNNVWNNSDQEGNYWSDYTGLDNGADDRIAGDGIGDTKIPHPGSGCDNYPFIYPNGWLFPGQPLLVGPGEVDNDGFYMLSWNYQPRATGFVLEEDINITFNSSTLLFNDLHIFYYVMNKPNGTYYYRLRAYNENNFGPWSETLKVTVDHIPDIPQELKVTVYPEGNGLNLSWVPNIVDTKEYELYYKNATIYYWTLLGTITHPNHTFNHTGLNDGERYYYSILAKDLRDQLSDYSNPVDAIPTDSRAPNAPKELLAEAISGSEVQLTWFAKLEQDISGFDIYINDTNQNSEGTFHPCQSVKGREPSCIISGLIEQTTYHFKIRAIDEVPNYSNLSNVASITMPDLKPPSPPTELVVTNATSNSLMIIWNASPEIDVIGYRIYRSQSLAKPFNPVFSEVIDKTQFIDTGLNESTMYFYRVKAVDDAQLESKFSEVVYGMTILGPYPPEINNSMSNIELPEDSYDNVSINLYHWFKDPNNDQLSFHCEGQENIEITIFESNGTVILKPKPNWFGTEIITFYVSDGEFEISENVTIIVTSMNDPPGPVEIIQPKIGKRIYEDEFVDFKGTCDDPDLTTGDVLTFSWSSDISGNLGAGQNLSGVMLPVGKHTVTFEVTDSYGETASTSIRINVFEKSDSDETETKKDYAEIYTWTGAFIIFIIIVFIIYLIVRKKGPYTTGKFDEEIDIELEPEGLELPEEPMEAKKVIEQEDAQIEPLEIAPPEVAEIPPTSHQPTLPPADMLEEPVEEQEPTLLPEDEDSSIETPQVPSEEEPEEKSGEDLEDVLEE